MRSAPRRTSLIARLLVTLGLLGAVMAMSTCSDVVDALNPLAFHPDSCAEFSFWRNDTLLVKDLKIGVVRALTESKSGCRVQNWGFEDDHSWMHYGMDPFDVICDDFDAEIHTGKRYWEVTRGNVSTTGITFAEGEWKLHEVNGKIDKIIDGGTFKFDFQYPGTCP